MFTESVFDWKLSDVYQTQANEISYILQAMLFEGKADQISAPQLTYCPVAPSFEGEADQIPAPQLTKFSAAPYFPMNLEVS